MMMLIWRSTVTMALAFSIAMAHAEEPTPEGLQPAEWAAILEQIESEVDRDLISGEGGSGQGGVDPRNGLMRTAVLTGDFSDIAEQDSTDGPRFGHSVSIDGDWMVVGAPGTRFSNEFQGLHTHGATFLFQRNAAGEWELNRRLLNTVSTSGARCGHAVAIRYPHFAVGCPNYINPQTAQHDGHVFLYRIAPQGVVSSRLLILGFSGGRCGTSVAITDDHMAIGCPNVSTNDHGGRVRVYRRNEDNTFSLEVTLNPPNAVQNAEFGASVALFQSAQLRLAVGAPTRGTPGPVASGAVHVFERNLVAGLPFWSQTDFITAPVQNALATFGRAVAMNNSQMLVGAPNDLHGGPSSVRSGRVYRYARTGSTWQFQQVGYAHNEPGGAPNGPESDMRFGNAVALGFDNFIAIGAPLTNGLHSQFIGAQNDVGLVEIRRGGAGQISVSFNQGVLRPPPITPTVLARGQFGTSIDFDIPSRVMVIGYPGAGSAFPLPNGARRGQVWVYGPEGIFSNGFEGLPRAVNE